MSEGIGDWIVSNGQVFRGRKWFFGDRVFRIVVLKVGSYWSCVSYPK